MQADLDDPDLPVGAYDVIVDCRFINRGLIPRMKDALKDGGYLLYEHHLLSERGHCERGGAKLLLAVPPQ